MAELKTVQVIVAMNAAHHNTANIEVKSLAYAERMANALKTLAMIWGIGIACVFVPVLHFFLVPTAIIVGIAMSLRKFGLAHQFTKGEIDCPDCHKKFAADQRPFNWPKHRACPHCQVRLLIEES
jgi:hypothetical protein